MIKENLNNDIEKENSVTEALDNAIKQFFLTDCNGYLKRSKIKVLNNLFE